MNSSAIFTTTSRRTALLAGLLGLSQVLPAQETSQKPPDVSFRFRAASIDSMFQRARKARAAQSIPYSAYDALVRMLREEELALMAQARAHEFTDEAEAAHWHRGRLKFPSVLEQELRLLDEGKDPAISRR